MSTDLYKTLGVERDVSEQHLKKSFKRLAMRYHPDRNKETNAEQKFKDIQKAYSILSDPDRKAQYDQFGTVDQSQGREPESGFNGSPFSDVFNDIFREFTGGGSDRRSNYNAGPREGRTIEVPIELNLEDTVKGCTKKIRIGVMANCKDCKGSGQTKNSNKRTCGQCNGTGTVNSQVGFFSMQKHCSSCKGAGQIIENPCNKCKGGGRIRSHDIVDVNIPAGIDHGDVLRVPGKGDASTSGGPRGDLHVIITFRPHELFLRQGKDLFCEIPVPFTTAALGKKVNVPTLISGYHEINIPKGLQNGQRLRIKGKGFPGLRSDTVGHLYCTITIETPQNLSEDQISILEQLDKTLMKNPKKHSPVQDNWIKQVKNFFSRT